MKPWDAPVRGFVLSFGVAVAAASAVETLVRDRQPSGFCRCCDVAPAEHRVPIGGVRYDLCDMCARRVA